MKVMAKVNESLFQNGWVVSAAKFEDIDYFNIHSLPNEIKAILSAHQIASLQSNKFLQKKFIDEYIITSVLIWVQQFYGTYVRICVCVFSVIESPLSATAGVYSHEQPPPSPLPSFVIREEALNSSDITQLLEVNNRL